MIIPARGGSKGIPKKNIVDVGGRPLIDYTIRPALELLKEGFVDNVIVSTDNREIGDIAELLGAEVPFLRPKEISTDTSKSLDVILHTLKFYANKAIYFKSVIILQPTSPLRTQQDILQAISLYRSSDNQSLISVYKEDKYNKLILYRKDRNLAVPLDDDHNKGVRRQDSSPVYVRNGAIYISENEYIAEHRQLFTDRPLLFEMPKERSLNIDSQEDLEYLRWIISRLDC